MKAFTYITILSLGLLATFNCQGQTPGKALSVAPQDPVPGLLTRVYLDGDPDPKKFPTHLIAVIADGNDFVQNYKSAAQTDLRGISPNTDIFYVAWGYIILEEDTEVKFTCEEVRCFVDRKDFGPGTYTKKLKKGRHEIEVTRQWGHGLKGFSVTDAATGKPVLYYTGQMLSRELGRSFKLAKRTFKTQQIGAPAKP